MSPEQQKLLIKARDSLRAAELLIANDLFDFATARAYYTMFYLAEAFLLQKKLSFSSHAAVISAFGREFAKTQRVPVQYHRYLIEAQDKRTEADYGLNSTITLEIAQEIIQKAQAMLDFTISNLESL